MQMFAGKKRFTSLASVKEKASCCHSRRQPITNLWKKIEVSLEIRYKGIGFSLFTKIFVVKYLLYQLIFDIYIYIVIRGKKIKVAIIWFAVECFG